MKTSVRLMTAAIRLYQATLSPDHSWRRARHPFGFCRHYPTCSAYALEAIERHGAWRGTALAIRRVLRCAPWSRGGVDLVPQR